MTTRDDMRSAMRWALGVCTLAVSVAACQDTPSTGVTDGPICELDTDLLVSSLAPNAIPALTEPPMVSADDPGAQYLFGTDRILGVVVDGEARAYPHNIFWWHEIVNDRIGDTWMSVTFCPLTGSGLAFDPNLEGFGRLDLGVSGLLFANNLVMYDRESGAVYGPQLAVEGTCGPFTNSGLTLAPVREMSWARWRQLHPDTKVVSGDLNRGRDYREYPYGDYDRIDSDELLVPMQVDRSRDLKERVLAIRVGEGGRGYPFLELQELGSVAAVNEVVGGAPTVVFFEEGRGMSAVAYDARVDGEALTFRAEEADGVWVDEETGSTWTLDGMAVDGPLQGERLSPRADAYVLFWFAWRHFQPAGSTFDAS